MGLHVFPILTPLPPPSPPDPSRSSQCTRIKNNYFKNGQRNWIFFQRPTNGQEVYEKMLKRYMKRCSTSLIIREMQIKTTVRYHLTPVRMTIVMKTRNYRCWQGCGERNPCTLLIRMQIGAVIMENTMEVPQKIQNRIIIWSSSGYININKTKRNEISTLKKYLHSSLLKHYSHHSQDAETPEVSSDR